MMKDDPLNGVRFHKIIFWILCSFSMRFFVKIKQTVEPFEKPIKFVHISNHVKNPDEHRKPLKAWIHQWMHYLVKDAQ